MARGRAKSDIVLRRQTPRAAWFSIAWRAGAVLALIGLMVLFHWLDRAGLEDELDGELSLVDAIYFTMISATTTGYGDIVPVTARTRLFDALVVTPVRVFLLLIFVGSAYLIVARRSWERFLMKRIQRNLHDHIVVAGFGKTAAGAVDELLARGTDPATIVVLDPDPMALEAAEALGCPVSECDATRDATLKAVRVERAKLLLASAGRDDTSILICLTARHLAPHLPISAVIKAEDNELLARQAGATMVINPVSFAGLLLASSVNGASIADYLADLASTHGRVQLHERPLEAHEVGLSLGQITSGLGVRIIRNGVPHGFWEAETRSLQEHDRIVEIRPSAAIKELHGFGSS